MIKRLDKLPKTRKVTVWDLLDKSTVSEVIADLAKSIEEIEDIVVIYGDAKQIHFWANVDYDRQNWLLDVAKYELQKGRSKEEE